METWMICCESTFKFAHLIMDNDTAAVKNIRLPVCKWQVGGGYSSLRLQCRAVGLGILIRCPRLDFHTGVCHGRNTGVRGARGRFVSRPGWQCRVWAMALPPFVTIQWACYCNPPTCQIKRKSGNGASSPGQGCAIARPISE